MKKKRFLASLLCCSLLFTSNSMLTFASSTTMTATFTATAEMLGGDLMITIPDEISLTKNGDVMSGSGVVTAQGVIDPVLSLFVTTDTSILYTNQFDKSIKVNADVSLGTKGVAQWTAEQLKANSEEDLKPNPNESNKLSHTVTVTLPMTDVEYIGDYDSNIVFNVSLSQRVGITDKAKVFLFDSDDTLTIKAPLGGEFYEGWFELQDSSPTYYTKGGMHFYSFSSKSSFTINKAELLDEYFRYYYDGSINNSSKKQIDFFYTVKKPLASNHPDYIAGTQEYEYIREKVNLAMKDWVGKPAELRDEHYLNEGITEVVGVSSEYRRYLTPTSYCSSVNSSAITRLNSLYARIETCLGEKYIHLKAGTYSSYSRFIIDDKDLVAQDDLIHEITLPKFNMLSEGLDNAYNFYSWIPVSELYLPVSHTVTMELPSGLKSIFNVRFSSSQNCITEKHLLRRTCCTNNFKIVPDVFISASGKKLTTENGKETFTYDKTNNCILDSQGNLVYQLEDGDSLFNYKG